MRDRKRERLGSCRSREHAYLHIIFLPAYNFCFLRISKSGTHHAILIVSTNNYFLLDRSDPDNFLCHIIMLLEFLLKRSIFILFYFF